MIERAARVLNEAPPEADLGLVAEAMLREALNDPEKPAVALPGQTSIGVVDGATVVLDG